MAPFAPFLAEEIYRNLNVVTQKEVFESVHLATIPMVDESAIDAELEQKMDKAQRIVYLVRAMRNKSSLRVRQPLRRIILPVSNERDREAVRQMEDVILDEVNVKAIEYVSDDSEIVHKKAKPNFKVIGPKHGKLVQVVANAIRSLGTKEINELEAGGETLIRVDGSNIALAKEDVEILHEDIKGWMVESDSELTVALDTELTAELVDEGIAREFVNRVQNMRKDAGFEVTDRIRISYEAPENIRHAVDVLAQYICTETLANEVKHGLAKGKYESKWEIVGEQCAISIERIRQSVTK
jgi:isoleucyl-tRNA synthetase